MPRVKCRDYGRVIVKMVMLLEDTAAVYVLLPPTSKGALFADEGVELGRAFKLHAIPQEQILSSVL